jgi:protein gp37
MAETTNIEWCDATFNPWEGCQKVGPGCDHCYAETRNARFGGGLAVNWGPGAPRRRTSEANWKQPLKWNSQAQREGRRFRVFCASLADVFDNQAPPEWRADLFRLIEATPHLDWLLLTKRIGNVEAMAMQANWPWPMPRNVWLGITVVNQAEADRDIPKLLAVPAHVRFLSIEPMLGPIDLMWPATLWPNGPARCCDGHECGCQGQPVDPWLFYGINWVIVGGESGRGQDIRPMHPQWARDLRDQCAAAGVPFLFKQWGEWHPACGDVSQDRLAVSRHGGDAFRIQAGERARCFDLLDRCQMHRVGKKAAGRLLDGRTHDEFPIPSQGVQP